MANFNVTQATDNGLGDTEGTLSWAILQANTDGETLNSGDPTGSDDTITLQTNVQLDGVMTTLLNSNIEIIGNGFTIDGDSSTDADTDGDFRPLFVKSGTVTLNNLTVTNGLAKGGDAGVDGGGGAGMGGGLFIYDGDVTLNNVTFDQNQAVGGNTGAGGNNNDYGSGGGGMYGNSDGYGGGGLFACSADIAGAYGGDGNYRTGAPSDFGGGGDYNPFGTGGAGGLGGEGGKG